MQLQCQPSDGWQWIVYGSSLQPSFAQERACSTLRPKSKNDFFDSAYSTSCSILPSLMGERGKDGKSQT